jgi:hypothetical protein
MLASDGHDFRLGMIAVRGQTDEVLIQDGGDVGLWDDALDQGAAVPSHLAAEFDEDAFAGGMGFGQGVGELGVPAHRATIVKMGM